MKIKDLPEGKIAVVVGNNDPWRGHCLYRHGGAMYFVGMIRDTLLLHQHAFDTVEVRVVGSIQPEEY